MLSLYRIPIIPHFRAESYFYSTLLNSYTCKNTNPRTYKYTLPTLSIYIYYIIYIIKSPFRISYMSLTGSSCRYSQFAIARQRQAHLPCPGGSRTSLAHELESQFERSPSIFYLLFYFYRCSYLCYLRTHWRCDVACSRERSIRQIPGS